MRFSFGNAAAFVALGLAAAMLWSSHGKKSGRAPALSYADTKGHLHSFANPERPAVVVLWVTPCSYCTRALGVLDRVRSLYPEEDLDVVGIYLNPADDAEVDRIAEMEGHRVTMARGQPSGPFLETLLDGFGFRGTGRDVFVVGRDGRFVAVDASDVQAPSLALLQRVRTVLINDLHLKERAG